MQVGLCLYGLADDDHAAIAVEAERIGFESVWLPDHLALPVRTQSRYPYSADGDSGLTHTTPFVDPWVALAFIAATTTDIRLGTYVYLLPLRHPVITAKSVSSLDALSGGRVLMGIGMGWMAEEFEAVDAGFDDRFSRGREAVAVIRSLWRDDVVEHRGPHYDISPVGMTPKPARRSVPIILGGHSTAALRRAAQIGDGWIGSPTAPAMLNAHLAETLPLIDEQLEAAGRDRGSFEVTSGVIGIPTMDQVRAADQAGLDRLIVGPWLSNPTASVTDAITELEQMVGLVTAGS